jgi:molecular chaperone GrpE (heat shock protein)
MLGRPSADQREYFPAGATLGKTKQTNNKTKKKKQNSKTLNSQPVKCFSMPCYTINRKINELRAKIDNIKEEVTHDMENIRRKNEE